MATLRKILKWVGQHRFLSAFLTLVVLGLALFAKFFFDRSDGELTGPIKRGTIVESIYGIGTVTANKIYRISPGVVNTISDLFVREGDAVKKGQKLFGNDSQIFRAPFDGTVTSLPYRVGENIFPQVPVLTLVDLQDRYLVVSMEQQGALRVQRGQKVKMSFDTFREKNYDGTVSSVYSSENNFLARIDVSNLPAQILPGMTADVAIEIRQHDNALLIPVTALELGKFIWLKRNHKIPEKIEIKTGIIDKALAEVTSENLEEGDQLLIRRDLNK